MTGPSYDDLGALYINCTLNPTSADQPRSRGRSGPEALEHEPIRLQVVAEPYGVLTRSAVLL